MLIVMRAKKMTAAKIKITSLLFLITVAMLFGAIARPRTAQAADNNFSNGITVDSVFDTPDDNVGDGICDDGDGNCTLRAAIEEANDAPDADTIGFNIAGSGVKTIQLNSVLPNISSPLTIDGYSQPGSQVNTAVSPLPFNGTLLIQIDGSSAGGETGFLFASGSSDSSISGLIINSFEKGAVYLGAAALSNITISGNYIGTNSTGLAALGNQGIGNIAAIQIDADPAVNVTIGGSTAAARNIISGNSSTSGVSMGNAATGSIAVRGNYIGLGANGTTDLGNGQGLSLHGGGSIIDNVISGNSNENLYHGGSGVVIAGNRIGTDYHGNVSGSIVQGGGVVIGQSASEIVVGGTSTSDQNIIAGNSRAGVQISSIYLPFPLTLTPSKIAVLGNSIFANTSLSFVGGMLPGLGIDLMHVNLDGSFQPASVDEEGVTPNDAGDVDAGPNNYINFPVLHNATQNGNNLTISFDLDAADSSNGTYRVEFFASDTPNSTGHGAGATYLGSATVSNGSGQTVGLILPNSSSFSSKVISATTTAIDTTTDSGFGATSEFSANVVPNVASTGGSQGELAATGSSQQVLLTVALICLALSVTAYRFKPQSV